MSLLAPFPSTSYMYPKNMECTQLALEQHGGRGVELLRPTYTQTFFNKYIGNFLEICENLKKIFFFLSYFTVIVQYMIHMT